LQIVSFIIDIEIRPRRCDLRPTISLKWTQVKKSMKRMVLFSCTGAAAGDLPPNEWAPAQRDRNTVRT